MKKRLFACLMAFLLLMTAACGGTKDSTAGQDTADSPPPADNSGTQPESGAEPDAEPEPEPEPAEAELTRGIWQDNVYVNESAGLTITRPDSWVAATDEELASLIGQGSEIMDVDSAAFEKAMESTVYDMAISDAVNGNNLMVAFENVSETAVFSANLTAENYISILKQQLQTVEDPAYTFAEETPVYDIGGQQYACLDASASTQGVTFHQYYLVRRQGDHMLAIICTGADMTAEDFVKMMGSAQ